MSAATPILEARGLAMGYGRRVVGRDLDLALAPGEIVALLGPNGGGKTTLLKTMLGLLPPLAGTVLIEGRPAASLGPRERARRLAYVPQVHAGTFPFSVDQVVMMGRSPHAGLLDAPSSRDRDAVAAALDRLGLLPLAARSYTAISGGERQLALIARALAQEPRAILLDEPTASLDFGNQGAVMAELRRLAASGLGILVSTHDPNHARRHADRAMLIRDGGYLAVGSSREVITAEALRALYGAEIVEIGDGEAFLPG